MEVTCKEICRCCETCTGCLGFQKILELKNAGLVIYRHTDRFDERNETTGVLETSIYTMDDVFIIHNTKDTQITADECITEIDVDVSCPRCRELIKRTKRYLQNILPIEKRNVTSICDHCQQNKIKHTNCYKCNEILKKYISQKEKQNAAKEQVKKCLSNVQQLLENLSIGKRRKITFKRRSYSELYLNRVSKNDYKASRHCKVEPLCDKRLRTSDSVCEIDNDTLKLDNVLKPYDPEYMKLKTVLLRGESLINIVSDTYSQSLTTNESLQGKAADRKEEQGETIKSELVNKIQRHIDFKSTIKPIKSPKILKKYSSEECLFFSADDFRDEENEKFRYVFPKEIMDVTLPLRRTKTSAELIIETENKQKLQKQAEGDKKMFSSNIVYDIKEVKSGKEKKDKESIELSRKEKKDKESIALSRKEKKDEKFNENKDLKKLDPNETEREKEDKTRMIQDSSKNKKKGSGKNITHDIKEDKRDKEKEDKERLEKIRKERKDGKLEQNQNKKEEDAEHNQRKLETDKKIKELEQKLNSFREAKIVQQKTNKTQQAEDNIYLQNTKDMKILDNEQTPITFEVKKQQVDDNIKQKMEKRLPEKPMKIEPKQKTFGKQANQKKPKPENYENETNDYEIDIKNIQMRKATPDDLILKLVKLRQLNRWNEEGKTLPTSMLNNKLHGLSKMNGLISDDSELEFDVGILNEKSKGEISDIIIGNTIVKCKHSLMEKSPTEEMIPILYKSLYNDEHRVENITKLKDRSSLTASNKSAEPELPKGLIRYALSDRSFIDKGWTMLPTEKIVRKMNVYRMRPAHPEFDWFNRNKNKRLMLYDTGEKLAEFDDNGRGRWFYRNGRLALDYYDAEEINAQQRFVIYGSGEPDERGRCHPAAILATFDYLGNGIVFDHTGKIRLKYNQTEGIVLDRNIGPVSQWKWHTLNDPPALQQVMIDTQMPHKDPDILKLGGPADNNLRPDNEEMLAIEFDNFIKEKSKKLSQKFKPFQIRTKALKINENFSLRVLDQANIYLIFRDGSTNMKMNIGMILDHQEIVDTDTAEVGEVSNNLERLPARTDSLAGLQRSVAHAQHVERLRLEREHRLRRPQQILSTDKFVSATSRPLKPKLQTVPSCSSVTKGESYCKCRKPCTRNIYYDTRFF